jgi:DNA (cytosine-5)-methyltransferase 1
LADKTLARIRAGIERYWAPFITEHVHEYRTRGLDKPLSTVTAGGHHFGLAVPVEGRDGKQAAPVDQPLRTMTTRSETGLLVPTGGTWRTDAVNTAQPMPTRTTRENDGIAMTPFIAELRGGGSKHRPVSDPLCTVVANGNHHGLVTAYYGNGSTRPASEALATVTATERHALLMRNNSSRSGDGAEMTTPVTEPVRTVTTTGHQSLLAAERPTIDVDDVLFRMLEPREIAGAMDFPTSYRILGNRREQVRQAGNAVTPPTARDLVGVVAESLGVGA